MPSQVEVSEAPATQRRFGARRHYKQRWDPNAEFVWRRRCLLRSELEEPYTAPGDRVDKNQLASGKLRMLWNAGYIELADWTPPEDRRHATPKRARAVLHDDGGGWYTLEVAGQRAERIRGRKAMEAFVVERGLDLAEILAGMKGGKVPIGDRLPGFENQENATEQPSPKPSSPPSGS